MGAHQLTVQDVFEFSADEKDFWPSPKFAQDLREARCPFLVMLLGNGRAGKSTRANQLLTHKINPTGPFAAADGMDPITKRFQYVGPVKWSQLATLHGRDLTVESDPDIFFIDCEGLHSLAGETSSLKQATFALSQMVSLTVLVMKDQVNYENIEHVRSLFMLSHAFSLGREGFVIGTAIVMRETGVNCDSNLQLDEKNACRQEADARQRDRVSNILNSRNIVYSPDNLLVLGQPKLAEQDLYLKSMDDLVDFTGFIARHRISLSGELLLGLFNEAKPRIVALDDLRNPSIPVQEIIKKITTEHLTAAMNEAIRDTENRIERHFRETTPATLRNGLDPAFVAQMTGSCQEIFNNRARSFFPDSLKYLANDSTSYEVTIRDTVNQSCIRIFVNQCIVALIPQVEVQVDQDVKAEIERENSQLPVQSVDTFSFTSLSSRHETSAESRLRSAAKEIHPTIPDSPEFPKFLVSIRRKISNYVKDVESRRKAEHSTYVRAEQERKNQELKAKHDAEIAEEKRRTDDERRRADEANSKAEDERRRADEAEQDRKKAEKARQDAEQARHDAEVKRKAEEDRRRADEDRKREEKARHDADVKAARDAEAKRQADAARKRADDDRRRADDDRRRAEEERRRAEEERRRVEKAEQDRREAEARRVAEARAAARARAATPALPPGYRRVQLVGPYWIDADGRGKAYTTACGWPDLVAEHRKPGRKCPYRVQQLKHVGTDDSIGWCSSSSLR